jgi:hypothetical protein
MGLNQNDTITRRRMAQKLEFLTSDLAQMQQPQEGELEQFFAKNQDTYREPDTISFTHIFFNPDKRKDATYGDAARVLAQLQAAGVPDAETIQSGDSLILQDNFSLATELEISRQLGSGFTESVMNLEPGRWHGPVLSGYGVHLVYVYEFHKAPPATFEESRERVLTDWHEKKRLQFNAEFLETLMNQYQIVIDELPADRLLDGQPEATSENLIEGEASDPKTAS